MQLYAAFHLVHPYGYITRKEEGKDQELIQSSMTPDPGHHMRKLQNTRNITYKRAKRLALVVCSLLNLAVPSVLLSCQVVY